MSCVNGHVEQLRLPQQQEPLGQRIGQGSGAFTVIGPKNLPPWAATPQGKSVGE